MSNFECPYCDKDVEPYDDECDPEVDIEIECPHCQQAFMYQIEYYPTYTVWKTPCLNEGGEHEWLKIDGYPAKYYQDKRRCAFCNAEKIVKQTETQEHF